MNRVYWLSNQLSCNADLFCRKTTGNGITLKIGASRRKTYSKYLQVRKAKNVFVNPNYSPITVDNDIALIELDRPVYFNDFLRPICLPQPKKVTPVGTRCYAVGWGKRIATGIILLYFRCLYILQYVQWTYRDNVW